MNSAFPMYLAVMLVLSCIMGAITKTINENKGYEGGFAWGFWLGFIGIIIVACKQPANRHASDEIVHTGGWDCKCGRYHASSTATCACGITRNELLSRNTQKPSAPVTPTPAEDTADAPLKDAERKPLNLLDETNKVAAIKEYKTLLDEGAITQEEFDTKKKDLLSN